MKRWGYNKKLTFKGKGGEPRGKGRRGKAGILEQRHGKITRGPGDTKKLKKKRRQTA